MAATGAKRRVRMKGRSIVAIGLLAFIAVTSLVIWRRSVGVATAKAMLQAATVKRDLQTQKTTLERDIREAQSQRQVVAEAERRLGFHVASDSQTRVIVESGKTP